MKKAKVELIKTIEPYHRGVPDGSGVYMVDGEEFYMVFNPSQYEGCVLLGISDSKERRFNLDFHLSMQLLETKGLEFCITYGVWNHKNKRKKAEQNEQ